MLIPKKRGMNMEQKNMWFQLSSDILIDRIGYVNKTNKHPVKKERAYWIFVMMEKGQRTLYMNGNELRVKARDFLLLPPDSCLEPLDLDEHAAWFVHFRAPGNPIPSPQKLNTTKIVLPLYGHLPSDFDCYSYMKYILKQYNRPYINRSFCATQLQSLFFMISLYSQKHKIWRPDEATLRENLLEFIQMNGYKALTSQDYESAFDLSYHQLNLLFKRQTGLTLKQHHQSVRMQNAAFLLADGKTIHETARVCGYDDYYFFIKCFKKAFGVTPGKYLKDNGIDTQE